MYLHVVNYVIILFGSFHWISVLSHYKKAYTIKHCFQLYEIHSVGMSSNKQNSPYALLFLRSQ